jgi:hypothetical protein
MSERLNAALNGRQLWLQLPIAQALLPAYPAVLCAYSGTAELVPQVLDGGVTIWGGVAARGGVCALGGISARGGVGDLDGIGARGGAAAWGGVGALGGVGVWGSVCILCRRTSGISSSTSSSSVKPAMTLHHFQLLSSSSIFKRPPCLRGQWMSSFGKVPLMRGPSRPPFSSCGAWCLSPFFAAIT